MKASLLKLFSENSCEASLIQTERAGKRADDKGATAATVAPFRLFNPARDLVAPRQAVLRASVEIAAARAQESAGSRAAPVSDRAADARAECRAAQSRASRTRVSFEVPPRGGSVEGVHASAARADGRALLAPDETADECAASDHRSRARLTTEVRMVSSARLRQSVRRERGE